MSGVGDGGMCYAVVVADNGDAVVVADDEEAVVLGKGVGHNFAVAENL